MHHGTARHTSLSPLSVGLRAKKSWCQGIDTPTCLLFLLPPTGCCKENIAKADGGTGKSRFGEEKGQQLRK